jgi:hypothetical protein
VLRPAVSWIVSAFFTRSSRYSRTAASANARNRATRPPSIVLVSVRGWTGPSGASAGSTMLRRLFALPVE